MLWMFNCREVSLRVSRAMDDRLPVGQRLAVRMHLLMCSLCRRYQKQLALMRQMLRRMPAEDRTGAPLFTLSADAKHRLRLSLSRQEVEPP